MICHLSQRIGFALLLVTTLSFLGCGKKEKQSAQTATSTPPETTKNPPAEPNQPTQPAKPQLVSREISYQVGDQNFRGYLATRSGDVKDRPGVIVVHEWWGHNDYARTRARQLAKMGYTALALDMYGDGKQAAHPKDAMSFANEAMKDKDVLAARFLAALKVLKDDPSTDPNKMAAIGYCFGGAVVLEMAKRGVDLDAVASFHGSLSTETPISQGTVKAKVFVAHGADDPFVTAEALEAFKKQMKDAAVDLTFTAYPGAKHSFTNPSANEFGKKFKLPLEYNEEADRKSWSTLSAMLTDVFSR